MAAKSSAGNAKFWCGAAPAQCDICQEAITDTFVDGKTMMGPWANMCLICHRQEGRGLGMGCGQKYQKQADGRWLKIGG